MPVVMSFHVCPKSVVRYTQGSRLFIWWPSMATNAVPSS
jgi:hypothetical protein